MRLTVASRACSHHSPAFLGGADERQVKLDEKEYEELLKPLAKELSAMARWVSETNQRIVVMFEGRDTAGKGGSIEMFARVLNPRQCRVVALPHPTNASARNGISSATSSICRRRVKSCCSTAAGTTARASRR